MDKQKTIAQVRQRYSAEVRSAERELRLCEERLKDARSRLEAVEDVVQALYGQSDDLPQDADIAVHSPYALMPLREAILAVLATFGPGGATAREIEYKLLEGGFPKSSKHFNAVVHITCKRLENMNVLAMKVNGGTRRFALTQSADLPPQNSGEVQAT